VGIAVLGPLTIEGEHKVLGRRDRVVLAALAVHPGEVVSAEALADVLWGERPPVSWPKIVQGGVVRLRKLLGVHAIETVPGGYRLAVPSEEIDAQRFERAVGRARDLLAAGEAERAGVVVADALILWRGRPLSELDGWDPARIEAARLTELRYAAEELYVESALRSGQHEKVLAKAQALVAEAPLRERRWTLLATAQYQSGRQREALATLRRLRAVLSRELGVDPGPDLEALEQAILRQDPSLVVAGALPDPSAVCPYQGLRPYDVDDADEFFGRDADVAACLRKLADTRVLAVVGPSGCGKSSLVRAGVAASLRRDGMTVVVMTPGAHPVAALAAAMPGTRPPAILLVDQCEEVFSLCHDTAERNRFLTAVTARADAASVILSFRADRMADVSSHPGFARVVALGMYVLAAMAEPDLRVAIEEPARRALLVAEPGLVDLLVGDVADHPGALPLMSQALAETWQRREGRTLTVAGYRASGGIRGAVAQSAEAIYERIAADQRTVLRDLLLRLVAPGPDGEPVRSRLPRRLVVTGPDDEAMIDLLVGSRLVTSDDGVVELAHEALARAWPRLRGWLEDDLEGQRILHHLAIAADSWQALGRPDSELYRGVRLAKALDWQERTARTLTGIEQNFLAASKRLSQAELYAAEERTRQQIGVNRRLRTALTTAALLLVGALIAGLVAVQQAGRADRQAAAARRVAIAADARRVGARARLPDEISLSVLLATAGVRLDDAPETRANLLAVLDSTPRLVRSAPGGNGETEGIAVSPDGRWIAVSDNSSQMHLYDARDDRMLGSYSSGPAPAPGDDGGVAGAFSPDGRFLAVGPYAVTTDPVRLLDPRTMREAGTRLAPARGFRGATVASFHVISVRFSADGSHLAATVLERHSPDTSLIEVPGYAMVWDLRSPGTPPITFPLGAGQQRMALSPDGLAMYTGWPLTAYDTATGHPIWQRKDIHTLAALDLSPDGKLLAGESHDSVKNNTMYVVETLTGQPVTRLRGHVQQPRAVGFSHDGRMLASVSTDGEAIMWNVATWQPIERWRTYAQSWSVAFSSDDRLVHTGGDDGMLRTWDLYSKNTLLQRTATARQSVVFANADLSPNGRRVALRWLDNEHGWIEFVDTATGASTRPQRLPVLLERSRSSGAWRSDGLLYANYAGCYTRCEGGGMSELDATTGQILRERGVDIHEITSLAYIDSGRTLLVGDSYGELSLLDSETLRHKRTHYYVASDCCITASADGRTALAFDDSANGASEYWRLIDVASGEVRNEGRLEFQAYDADASPDGSRVAVTGKSGELVTIDLSTGYVQPGSTGLGSEVLHVRYSDDGSRLVTGTLDGRASLWDARTLQLLGTVHPLRDGEPVAASVGFVEGSDDVTIVSYDGQIFRWDTSQSRTLDLACQMAGRNLTTQEWSKFLPNQPFRKVCQQFR
jgi:WD40 repeat protein/DNA-binding SARP family transcriptional activator